MNQSRSRTLLAPVAFCASTACQASVSADASLNASESQDIMTHPEGKATERAMELEVLDGTPRGPAVEPALFGARHDLRLATSVEAVCECLAVAVGVPNSRAFAWQSVTPTIDPATQLVIALSSEGVVCDDEPEGSLGASYWGYRTSNEDVIVVIEAARFGRPITTGAIVPRPPPGKRLLVVPVDDGVPYGKPRGEATGGCVVFEG